MPTVSEELSRIIPVLKFLEKYKIDVSVDTCRSDVVKEVIRFKNVKYINDISGLSDIKILDLISKK
jgi:dihydropteroate synthase